MGFITIVPRMDRLADFGTSLETRRGEPFSSCVTSFTFAHSVVTHAQRQSNRGNEMCDNEMSFSMMPQLSIMKSRFAKASLRTRYARHRSWGATCRFPNACLGYSPTQWLRWSSSFPNGSKGPSSRLRSSTIRPSLRLVHYSRVDMSHQVPNDLVSWSVRSVSPLDGSVRHCSRRVTANGSVLRFPHRITRR